MPVQKRKTKKWKIVVILILLIIFSTLAYYHFFYKAKQVDGGIARIYKVISDHRDIVWTLKFSPDNNVFASGSVDSTVKIRNNITCALIHDLKHPAGITFLNFSADGQYIATTAYDRKVRLWKVSDGSLVKEFAGHSKTPWSVSFSPDGKTIASSSEDATIKLWNVETGNLVRTLEGHELTVWSIQFSPDGSKIASGSFDKTVKIWNANDGKLLRTMDDHKEAIVALAFSPDGQMLATTSDDKTIKLWNINDGKLIRSLQGGDEHVQAVAFSPDGKRLLTGGKDKPGIGEFLQNFLGDSKTNKGVSMRLWDLGTGNIVQTFTEHANDVNDVSYSPDGKWIASASTDKTVRIWEVMK